MTAPSFTYSGNVYTAAAAGSIDFALTSTSGNPIAYLERAHIHVYKSTNQGSAWTELSRPSQWDFVSSGTIARLVTGIASGDWIKVQRITPTGSAYVTFQSSALLTAEQLNDDTLFNTYLNQEISDQADQTVATANSAVTTAAGAVTTANAASATANAASAAVASKWTKVTETLSIGSPWDSGDSKVATAGAIDGRIDAKIDTALTTDVVAGTDIAVSTNTPASGQITVSHSVTGANTTTANTGGSVISNLTVSAQGHVTALSSTNLDGRYYTETEADARYVALTGGQSVAGVKTFSSSPVVPTPSGATDAANKGYVDSYAWNKTADTIASNETWVNGDSNIPTTAAVTGRIVDLLNDIGSYVVVATEVTFPNDGVVDGAGVPDAGVLVEITDASGLAWNGSGTSTNATRANGSAVTITGITGTSPISGCGAQLLSTSTLHTYTFVKWTIASGVAQTISDNISEILQVDTNAAAAAASATAAAASQSAAASSASAAATSASNAATSATNAANSATAASSLVTTITNLSYLLNWGLITEAAGTSTDYGAL